jgi:cytochrome c oxidase assembly protein subunit 15
LKKLTGISLLLVILLVSLSAYLRLSHSGIGCHDWPQCYAQIGEIPVGSQGLSNEDAYQQLVEQSSAPLAWATPLHRLVASVLGLLVVFLNVLAVRQHRYRVISFILLLLTVGLAVLGIKSGSLHDPAVVMGNLLGGFSMLGLLGWLWFDMTSQTGQAGSAPVSRLIIQVGIVFLLIQISMGGLTSANFAATSCQTIPDCHGSWWPGPALSKALDLRRTHEVTPSGQAIGGMERVAIHKAHRIGAMLASALILITGFFAVRGSGAMRQTGWIIVLLVMLEFSVGVASVLSGLPIILAVAHNWLAGLLLLSLLRLDSLQARSS